MNDFSPLAWIAIVLIVLITAAVNIGMVMLLRQGPGKLNQLKPPKSDQDARQLQGLIQTLRDPFGQERDQLQDLSTRVRNLQKPPHPDDDD